MEDSPGKNNLSFSFNLDLDSVDDDASSDLDTAGLQIDVSEVESFNDNEKIRRSVDDTSFLNEMEEEIERQLDAKAAKTNLTATNVKNILKHVISNEHVMAIVVHKRLTTGDDEMIFQPKLTRAKVKELAMELPDIPWPMTPAKNTTSEVQILIQEEFSEDSSDEEYHPDKDAQSDDEKDTDNTVGSDFDSQPSTPATPGDLSTTLEMPNTPEVHYDEEGFKIPQLIPHVPTEEESIGHRTRSKFCLSETPLEQIEQAFIPPDITTDMYDWDWEPDDDYINFLKELYTQPLPKEVNCEDDPEADPEYNILDDEETNLVDKEELRQDKAVKIPKKELKTLIAELDEFADQYTKQHQEQEQEQQQQQKSSKKKKSADNSFSSTVNVSPGNPMVDLLPVLAEPELPELVNAQQQYLLTVQISQHVQLMTQQYLMTYKHPQWHQHSTVCKSNLNSLRTLGDKPDSEFRAWNLADALDLVSDWESKLAEPVFLKEYLHHVEKETQEEKDSYHCKRKYKPQFHPELIRLMAGSKALMHPQLLPTALPSTLNLNHNEKYLHSEESLMAIGLEQFIPYRKALPKKFNKDFMILADAVREIQKYLLPTRNVPRLLHHIKKRRYDKKPNAIKHYFKTGFAPKTQHCVLSEYELLPPKRQPIKQLPPMWQHYISKLQKGDVENLLFPKFWKTKSIYRDDESFSVSQDEILVPGDHELRNPIVNMLRHMPSLLTPQKDESGNSTSKFNGSKNQKTMQSKSNEPESDAESAESLRTCETDEEESRPTRLRMTTPRLAKIKSAQNMKLLAQTLSPKASASSSSTAESKEYSFDKTDDDESSFAKGDDEDEIAELMLASTTIKKNTTSRKKTKQAREIENFKRLLEAENNINEDERATKFAASFIQKVHVKLESKDPELFKTILKIFLDYSEKIENINEDNSDCSSNITLSPLDKEKLAIDLYKEVCEKLHEYPDLCSDLLLFLTPHQAALIDKSVDHTMVLKMKEFLNVSQMYFAKQPSRIAKVMQAITEMAANPGITLEGATSIMGTALKGHPLMMDMFLQVLPTGKPPDSLFAAHMFENLTCPVGPHDKNKKYDPDAQELYENIELPVSTPQEDPYGGDSCKCDCHNLADDMKLKGMNEHCASCGTRFLNGRIYLQTSEGLRPAKITFPGEDDEKLENISRVSLKTTERFIPSSPPRKRRKSAKRDSISEESSTKSCTSKALLSKDIDDNDKSGTKSQKGLKSPPKSTDNKKTSSTKNKRERKNDKKDNKTDQKTDDEQNEYCITADQTESEEFVSSNTNDDVNSEPELGGSKEGEPSKNNAENDGLISPEKTKNISFSTLEKVDCSSDSDSSTHVASEPSIDTPWTLQDDKILLEHLQKEYSEETFAVVSSLLKRSMGQVKGRCEYLLSLIEKMA